MTIVIATKNFMVSDSLISDNTSSQKLFRVKGDVIGIAGDLMNARRFVRWWGDKRCKKPDKDSEFYALVWRPKQKGLFYCDAHLDPLLIDKPFYAIGSGADVAKGAYAILSRFNGSEAFTELETLQITLEVVCEEDINCGGDVQIEVLL